MSGALRVKHDLIFVWENFGPIHADRCDAVAEGFGDEYRVIGLEWTSRSAIYDWDPEEGKKFKKLTLFPNERLDNISTFRQTFILLRYCFRYFRGTFFLCHYERLPTLLVALSLRISGHQVIEMNDSKFDDCERTLWREVVKWLFYLPYSGAIASGTRSRDYLRFLGVQSDRIELNYDTLNLERIVALADAPKAPDGVDFIDRHFSIVARLVPKKNIRLALEAYRIYQKAAEVPRKLYICGSGELENELKELVRSFDLEKHVLFTGFIQTKLVAKRLSSTLALILPSTEEQFGNVVVEAQALHVPVILSENCGARDLLVRSGVNGFVFEPDNAIGLAFFMQLLSDNEALWRRMCRAAVHTAWRGDVRGFVSSVSRQLGKRSSRLARRSEEVGIDASER